MSFVRCCVSRADAVRHVDEAFVVYGSTGEYSDRTEWPVRAFATEAEACNFIVALDAKYRELVAAGVEGYRIGGKNELDPDCRVDYTGLVYAYWKVRVGMAVVDSKTHELTVVQRKFRIEVDA